MSQKWPKNGYCEQPLFNPDWPIYDLGGMDVQCPNCHALHWMAEHLTASPNRNLRFSMCCWSRKIRVIHSSHFLATFRLLFNLLFGSFLTIWQKNDQKVTKKEMKNEIRNGYCETPGM